MELVPAASGEGRPIPQPRPVVDENSTGRCGGESGGPSTPVQQVEIKGENSLPGTVPRYFLLKPQLLKAFSSVGAVPKPYTFKEILRLLKDYLYKYNIIDPEDPRVVNCSNTELGVAFGVDRFEYDDVRNLLSKTILALSIAQIKPLSQIQGTSSATSDRKEKSQFCLPFPEVPPCQSGPESDHSYQGYETTLCHDSDTDLSEEAEEVGEEEDLEEYDLVTESEAEENKEQSDSELDVKSCILIVGVESADGGDSEEDFFADESESESDMSSNCYDTEGHSSDDEKDKWICPICGSTENRPYMGCCLKCFNLRKDWYPEPPKRRRRRKPRPKKDKKRGLKAKGKDSREEEVQDEEVLPSLQRTESTASTLTVASTSSSALAFSSQDSGFGSQDLSSFEPIRSAGRKRNLSDSDDDDDDDDDDRQDLTPKKKSLKEDLMGHSKDKYGSSSSSSLPVVDSTDKLCNLCCLRPKNASIIHGRISHIGFCYTCAKKLFNSKAKCPICRRKIHMITKNVYV